MQSSTREKKGERRQGSDTLEQQSPGAHWTLVGIGSRARLGLLLLELAAASVGCAESTVARRAPPAGLDVLAWEPDPAVVSSATDRAAIAALGLPWRVRHALSGIELLLVPAGEYERGASPGDEEAAADERPRHRVRILAPFYLGRYEVRGDEWARVMGRDPSHFQGEAELPVEQVSFLAVRDFLQKTGLGVPNESQWEYACRAGTSGARYGELERVAWHRGNAQSRPHPVGLKAPNALGFHDMLGNVWEWTSSWYAEDWYARCAQGTTEAEELPGGTHAVLRGGSWYDTDSRTRASTRYRAMWNFEAGHVGLRVSLAVPSNAEGQR